MFGHDDQQDEQDITTINPTVTTDDGSGTVTPADDPSVATDSTAAPAVDSSVVTPDDSTSVTDDTPTVTASTADAPASEPVSSPEDTATSPDSQGSAPILTAAPTADSEAPTDDASAPTASDDLPDLSKIGITSEDTDSPAPTPSPASSSSDDSLLDLKKTALEELAPLIDKLDQTPEEKFKTTMMMIQATDDSNLVNMAHEAAQNITDEKVRAQALLDIVNEINYFTQKDAS